MIVCDRGVLLLAFACLGWLIFTFADVLASLARTNLPTTGSPLGRAGGRAGVKNRAEQSRATQSKAEQSRAEERRGEMIREEEKKSRADRRRVEKSRAKQNRAPFGAV